MSRLHARFQRSQVLRDLLPETLVQALESSGGSRRFRMMHSFESRNTSPPQIPMLPHVAILQVATSPDDLEVVALGLQILFHSSMYI